MAFFWPTTKNFLKFSTKSETPFFRKDTNTPHVYQLVAALNRQTISGRYIPENR